MARFIPKSSKLTAFRPVFVPKIKDIFKRMGYRKTSQSVSGQVADFSRNPLESFDVENHKMSQYYYEKYVAMKQTEENQKTQSQSEEVKSDDNQTLEEDNV